MIPDLEEMLTWFNPAECGEDAENIFLAPGANVCIMTQEGPAAV